MKKTVPCPSEILALDANAKHLWPLFVKKAGVTIDKAEWQIIEDRRGSILKGIGIPDLIFRLSCQRQREKYGRQNEVARSRIWRHVAEACAPGDSIPDLSSDNLYSLNPWIVTKKLKFPDPRAERLRSHEEEEKKPNRRALEYKQAQMQRRHAKAV